MGKSVGSERLRARADLHICIRHGENYPTPPLLPHKHLFQEKMKKEFWTQFTDSLQRDAAAQRQNIQLVFHFVFCLCAKKTQRVLVASLVRNVSSAGRQVSERLKMFEEVSQDQESQEDDNKNTCKYLVWSVCSRNRNSSTSGRKS